MVYKRKNDYEYREGWHPNVEANAVGEVMEQIEEKNGSVTSELFLEASRAEESPTHRVFEWNDGIAAEKYRLHQASRTICAIRVVVRDEGQNEQINPQKPMRAFVNIARDDEKKAQYMNVCDAMSNSRIRNQVLQRALRELRAFQDKYSSLNELAGVFLAIEKVKHEQEKKEDNA